VLEIWESRSLPIGMSKESGVPTEGRSAAKEDQKSGGRQSPEEVT